VLFSPEYEETLTHSISISKNVIYLIRSDVQIIEPFNTVMKIGFFP